jgi:hypothetical protein
MSYKQKYFKYKLKYLKLKGIMTDNYILNGGQSNKTRNLNTNILNVDVLTQTPSMLDMYGYTFSDRDQVDTLNKLLNNEDKSVVDKVENDSDVSSDTKINTSVISDSESESELDTMPRVLNKVLKTSSYKNLLLTSRKNTKSSKKKNIRKKNQFLKTSSEEFNSESNDMLNTEISSL